MAKAPRTQVPKLRFTSIRDIGWHVCYRDPTTNVPRKHRFGITDRTAKAKARTLYHAWVAKHLGTDTQFPTETRASRPRTAGGPRPMAGSLIEVGSSLIELEQARVRSDGDVRVEGTIDPRVFLDRKKQIHDFLGFLNSLHGAGAVAKLRLADLTMDDVKKYIDASDFTEFSNCWTGANVLYSVAQPTGCNL